MNIEFPEYPDVKRAYHLNEDVFTFMTERRKVGEKLYGKGKRNVGYKRDNLLDVIEEVTDAITILGFFEARFTDLGDPMSRWDIEHGIMVQRLRTALVDTANLASRLRNAIADGYPQLVSENVERAVMLEVDY